MNGNSLFLDTNNAEIKKSVIEIRSKYSMKLPDAIVAATAKYINQLTVILKSWRSLKLFIMRNSG